MASYTITTASGQLAVHDKTLATNTADSVTFDAPVSSVEILTDGSAAVYVTLDGSTPSVSGQSCFKVPSASSQPSWLLIPGEQVTVVKLFSAGTPVYSVCRAAV